MLILCVSDKKISKGAFTPELFGLFESNRETFPPIGVVFIPNLVQTKLTNSGLLENGSGLFRREHDPNQLQEVNQKKGALWMVLVESAVCVRLSIGVSALLSRVLQRDPQKSDLWVIFWRLFRRLGSRSYCYAIGRNTKALTYQKKKVLLLLHFV